VVMKRPGSGYRETDDTALRVSFHDVPRRESRAARGVLPAPSFPSKNGASVTPAAVRRALVPLSVPAGAVYSLRSASHAARRSGKAEDAAEIEKGR
jgi:hypothetical protein